MSVTLAEAKAINKQAADYALNIACQMLDQMPPEALDNLCPTDLLRQALGIVDEIMEHRRDHNEPHPFWEAKERGVEL